jgi:hypothetical protein
MKSIIYCIVVLSLFNISKVFSQNFEEFVVDSTKTPFDKVVVACVCDMYGRMIVSQIPIEIEYFVGKYDKSRRTMEVIKFWNGNEWVSGNFGPFERTNPSRKGLKDWYCETAHNFKVTAGREVQNFIGAQPVIYMYFYLKL